MQTSIFKYLIYSLFVLFVGCKAGGDYTGTEYMPDMKHSRAMESFTSSKVFADGKTQQLPPVGTIARGYMPYHLENSNEAYEEAGRNIKSPYNSAEHLAMLDEGKALYVTYCQVCHGKEGNADGTIVKNGKYPPPPTYFRDDILYLSEGKMFHSITHGKNLMGSYSAQLDQTERWKVISYIKDMQAKYIAKNQSIEYDEALAKTFTGAGFMSTAQYESKLARANKKAMADPEYADLKSDKHFGFGNGFETSGKAHGHGAHGDHGSHDKGHQANAAKDDSYGKDNYKEEYQEEEPAEEIVTEVEEPAKEIVEEAEEPAEEVVDEVKEPIEEKKVEVEEPKENIAEKASNVLKKAAGLSGVSSFKSGQRFELKNVKFRPGSSRLQQSSNDELNQLADILTKNPNLKIEIGGHTDNTGALAMNNALSNERAMRVRDFLKSKGIAPTRLSHKGYGPSKPVATNQTAAGRAQNRRTEVKFL